MANGDRNKITDMNLIITEYTCQFKLYQLSSINIDMVKKIIMSIFSWILDK